MRTALSLFVALCLPVGALAAAVLAVRATEEWKLAKPALRPDGRVAKLDQLEDFGCAKCHADVVLEWSTTAHALAWVDELYQAELKERKKVESCWSCHVPQPLHVKGLGARPEARAADRHFGIACEACHLGADGAMLGPRGAPTDAHKSTRSDTMIGAGSNALCAACHRTSVGPVIGIAKDLELPELASKGLSCVGCHMGPTRTVEVGGEQRIVRTHELQSPRDPAFLALAFGLSARRDGKNTLIDVANHAGHRVPGLIGREIEFRATLLDAAGKELGEAKLLLDTSSYLPAGEKLSIELAGQGVKVHVVGLHHDPRLAEPVRFLDVDLTP